MITITRYLYLVGFNVYYYFLLKLLKFAVLSKYLNLAGSNVYNANECNFTRRFLIFKMINAER